MTEHEHHNLGHDITLKILIALGAGVVVGLILKLGFSNSQWVQVWLLDGVFEVVGQWFVRGLKMLIVPVVVVSLICGASSIADPAKLGRVGGKAIGLYLMTTAIAIILALTAAIVVKPGVGANPVVKAETNIAEQPGIVETLINIVPTNPVAAMADTTMLQIIAFALLIGIAITLAGPAGRRVGSFFQDLNEVVMKLVFIVMKLAPYGIFALITGIAATTNYGTFLGVLKYILLVLAVLIFHGLVVYPIVLALFSGLNPLRFLSKMRNVLLFAFSTSSSNATIPVTLRTVEKRIGANNKIASFTIPLGATINMDGTAIMQGIATGFIAQFYGIPLSVEQYLMVVLLVIMASIGAAGVPSVGIVLLAGVFNQVGLPAEGVALILGVDRILDMTRTAVNVTGDAVVTTVVAKSEGEFDQAVFDDPDAGDITPEDRIRPIPEGT